LIIRKEGFKAVSGYPKQGLLLNFYDKKGSKIEIKAKGWILEREER